MTLDRKKFAGELGEKLRTQDNRSTSDIVFAVEKLERIYGMDSDYADDYCYVEDEAHHDSDSREFRIYDKLDNSRRGLPDGIRKVYFKEHWIFVTACFTEDAAKQYILYNKHNLGETRIFGYSAYRNHEWIQIREYFMTPIASYITAYQAGQITLNELFIAASELQDL